MGDERAFDLGGAEPVAGDVDHVVDAPGDPVIAVLVAARAVAGEIKSRKGREIGVDKAAMIAIDGAHLAGPGARQAKISFARAFDPPAVIVDQKRLDPEERTGRGARLERRRAGERGDQNAAGLGLPPGVDNRAAALADMVVIPQPRLGVDRLADRAEDAQRAPAGAADIVLALAHQRADRGRRGVKDRDLVLVDDLPKARRVGIVGHTLEHQRRGAVGERPVEDVAVPGHPADIGGAPINLALAVVENVFMGHRRIDEIAAGRVQHPFGLPGRARGVKDKQRVLGRHFRRRAVGRGRRACLVIPDVAAREPS